MDSAIAAALTGMVFNMTVSLALVLTNFYLFLES